jgi:hypothetical protein
MSHPNARRDADREAKRLQSEIWTIAIRAAENDPNPTRSGLFIRALNETIDSYASRQAALDKHLPAIVLYMLFLMLIIAEVVLGYAGGLAQSQPRVATVSLSLLIVLVLFLVFDLDRPRRGFVQVNQASMLELEELIAEASEQIVRTPGEYTRVVKVGLPRSIASNTYTASCPEPLA